MATPLRPLSYTDLEIRSYLPSGWGILAGASGRWNADLGAWQVDVYDGADNTWTIAVPAREAASAGRLPALKSAIERLGRSALGRKSILTG